MKKKCINGTHVEGYLYQTNKLEKKVTGEQSKNPGTEYIRGEIQIATDDNMTNIVPVFFSYVTATTKQNKPNATYEFLNNVISGNYGTVMANGADKAVKVRIDSALALNEWYDDQNELISVMRNEGGFIHLCNELNQTENARNTFDTDIIITNVKEVLADPERQTEDHVVISGYIFNFRNDLLPVNFTSNLKGAMNYFMNLGATATTPVFTRIRGNQLSTTLTKTITEESAFGEASVRTITSNRKTFNVNWSAKDTYVWDDEANITTAEFKEKLSEREVYLATLKQNADEYRSQKNSANNAFATTAPAAPKAGSFGF